jgi:ribosomal protein L29
MKFLSLNTLRDKTPDELAEERQAADEELQKLRGYKKSIQQVLDERDAEEALSKVNLDSPTVRAALAQRIERVGGIESQEAVEGVA